MKLGGEVDFIRKMIDQVWNVIFLLLSIYKLGSQTEILSLSPSLNHLKDVIVWMGWRSQAIHYFYVFEHFKYLTSRLKIFVFILVRENLWFWLCIVISLVDFQSQKLSDNIDLFSTLVGQKKSLGVVQEKLSRSPGVKRWVVNQFCQGKTMRWCLAWTYKVKHAIKEYL